MALAHCILGKFLGECFTKYGDGNFPVGEDGSSVFCGWCADGGIINNKKISDSHLPYS
jgi:hypothetical protein